jgi:GDP-D-mannose dehydratase
MKFVITGITGFVGPHLAKSLLEKGHEVVGLTRSMSKCDGTRDVLGDLINKVEFGYLDIENEKSVIESLSSRKFDGLFHLAAFTHPPSSFERPTEAFRANALGTAYICDAIEKYNKQAVMMQCSTPEVYGVLSKVEKIDESFPMNPMNPYGVAKAAGDLYVLERTRNKAIKAFLTRAFSHTGVRRMPNYSIASDAVQIAKIIKGKQEPIIKVGNLAAQRAVLDVRDVAETYALLMGKYIEGLIENGELFILGGEEIKEIGWYLNKMLELFNVSAKTEVDPKLYRPIDIPIQIPDSTKIKTRFGWYPKIKIETTLTDLVNYWSERV